MLSCAEGSQLTPYQHICSPINARITSMYAAFQDFCPLSLRCMYPRQMHHVIAAHVSFGSQLQYMPQAAFAQSAPLSIPRVRKAVPIYRRLSTDTRYLSVFCMSPATDIITAQPTTEYENM